MIQFTYKLKLNERVRARCSHYRYNPEKHDIGGWLAGAYIPELSVNRP
jgi:hypothetical protein